MAMLTVKVRQLVMDTSTDWIHCTHFCREDVYD